MALAAEWRATFQKDVIIDIVCYRRNGHNEQDQPSFTSPTMYEVISKHATGLDIYSDRLISEGVVTPEYVDQEKDRINGVFEEAFVRSTSEGYQDESMWMESRWTKFKNAYEPGMPTGCDMSAVCVRKCSGQRCCSRWTLTLRSSRNGR